MRAPARMFTRTEPPLTGDPMVDYWLVNFLIFSGLVSQSVEKLRPVLPRWARRLRSLGFATVPDLRYAKWWSPMEVRAGNLINLWINQATGNQAMAHGLRNLTCTRPYKV